MAADVTAADELSEDDEAMSSLSWSTVIVDEELLQDLEQDSEGAVAAERPASAAAAGPGNLPPASKHVLFRELFGLSEGYSVRLVGKVVLCRDHSLVLASPDGNDRERTVTVDIKFAERTSIEAQPGHRVEIVGELVRHRRRRAVGAAAAMSSVAIQARTVRPMSGMDYALYELSVAELRKFLQDRYCRTYDGGEAAESARCADPM